MPNIKEKIDEQEWRESLKVGDEVILKSSGVGRSNMILTKVVKTTPTRFVIKPYNSERAFRKTDGREIGGRKSTYSWQSILKPTPERREQMERSLEWRLHGEPKERGSEEWGRKR